MRALFRIFLVAQVGLALLLLPGCNSSANNDQGVSVTFFGYFQQLSACGTGLSAVVTSISGGDSTEGLFTFFDVTAEVGVQNNLLGQGFRLDRAFMSYRIEGASSQPPSTSFPLGVILAPAGDNGSTLPDNFGGSIPNTICAAATIVPASIFEWINLNRASLPEPPFTMTVRTFMTGETTSGERLDTNSLDFAVEIIPDNVIPPTGGGDPGLGGIDVGEGEGIPGVDPGVI